MSDRLVVEFHHGGSGPFETVLVLHGGDNPHSSSLTLASFLIGIAKVAREGHFDAYEVATRFLVSLCAHESGHDPKTPSEAFLIAPDADYPYQLCRVYVEDGLFKVDVVLDEYSTREEVKEAVAIWDSVGISVEFPRKHDTCALAGM